MHTARDRRDRRPAGHCAPESGAGFSPHKLSAAQLKEELSKCGADTLCFVLVQTLAKEVYPVYQALSTSPLCGLRLGLSVAGKKAELAARLEAAAKAAPAAAAAAAAVKDEEEEEDDAGDALGAASLEGGAAAAARREPPAVRPGTAHIRGMASAAQAVADKVAAGESFAVEHVAIADDASLRIKSPAQRRGGGAQGGRGGKPGPAAATAPAPAAAVPAGATATAAPGAAAAIAAAVAKIAAAKKRKAAAANDVKEEQVVDGALAFRKRRRQQGV